MELITVTPQIQAERGLSSDRGALITGLSQEGQERTGLRPGDVIVQIGRVPIGSAEELARVFQGLSGVGAPGPVLRAESGPQPAARFTGEVIERAPGVHPSSERALRVAGDASALLPCEALRDLATPLARVG